MHECIRTTLTVRSDESLILHKNGCRMCVGYVILTGRYLGVSVHRAQDLWEKQPIAQRTRTNSDDTTVVFRPDADDVRLSVRATDGKRGRTVLSTRGVRNARNDKNSTIFHQRNLLGT